MAAGILTVEYPIVDKSLEYIKPMGQGCSQCMGGWVGVGKLGARTETSEDLWSWEAMDNIWQSTDVAG